MATISSGRTPKNSAPMQNKPQKSKKKLSPADITAVICAILCAGCLVTWSIDQKHSDIVAAAAIYDTPKEEKGFWDYFSEAVASAFGYNG